MGKLRRFIASKLSDRKVQHFYLNAGLDFGDAVSYVGSIGECFGFKRLLNRYGDWEYEYACRGFRTISLDDFIEPGDNVEQLIGIKREENEPPIYHAEIYRERYLGKIAPVINIQKLLEDGNPQTGTYIQPTTKS